MATTADWRDLAAAKRQSNAAKIPAEWRLPAQFLTGISETSDQGVLDVPAKCGILTAKELEITESADATALLERLARGELSAYEVTVAFCKRAAIAHQLVNCLTEIFFDDAIDRARKLDDHFKATGTLVGPLHGLPVSLKDSFNVKGVASTVGYIEFLKRPPSDKNSALVDILIHQLGAVPYVKTNLPQTMMTADSENNVFGRTLNPNKLSLTAGGSTGGEGALIKLRGSLMGICTDIAGSARIPALCNGIYGFKPTSQRLPFFGKTPPGRLGSPSQILPCIGVMAHSLRDLELFTKLVIDSEPWLVDDAVLNVPWRRVPKAEDSLQLGVIMETAKRRLHPSIHRTMRTLVEQLEKAGHTVVYIGDQVPDPYDTAVMAMKHLLLDPKKTPMTFINAAQEPWIASVKKGIFSELKDYSPDLDTLFDINVERRAVIKTYHDIVVGQKLEGIIMPAYQATAVPHDTYGNPPYTFLANMLDYPAVQIPFLQASEELDRKFVREEVTYEPPYDPKAVEGAPCGFQVLGRPMRDEELLSMTQKILAALST